MPIALQAMDIASQIAREMPSVVDAKGDRDMVSDVDVRIDCAVRAYLAGQTPQLGFLGEEIGDAPGSNELQWVLDPIDGTANFVKGIPLYAVSLALVTRQEPILGIIDIPADRCRYVAALGWGAYCGDEALRVRPTQQLKEAIVTVGDYAVGDQAAKKNQTRLAVTGLLAQRALRVRMLGSAAIDLAWLAHGRTDAAIIFGGKPWDTAAGVILVREAGGSVTDSHGQRHKIGSTSTVAASPVLMDQVLEVMA
jgi:myo-inositol-1(or 4)-monophosphatase